MRARLIGGFFSVILLFSLASLYATLQTLKNSATIEAINTRTLPDVLAFSEIQAGILKIQHWMSYASLTGDPLGLENAEQHYQLAQKALAQHRDELDPEAEAEMHSLLKALGSELEDFMSLGTQMVSAYQSMGVDMGNALMESFNPAADKITQAMEGLVGKANEGIEADFSALIRRFRIALLMSLGALLVSAALSLAIALWLAGSISKSVLKLLELTQGLSRGDLTGRLTLYSKDELGALSEDLSVAIGSVRSLVESVKARSSQTEHGARKLSGKVEEILEASSRISQGSEAIRRNFEGLVEAIAGSARSSEGIFRSIIELTQQVESQAGAVAQTTASIEEMSASLSNVDRVIEEKRRMSGSLLEVTSSGGEKVEATNEHIAEVSKNVEAIADLMEMIKGVSSQTNLLAMNASIEAAHAGEYGKGFAVVADEIRKLAETTGESAKQVSSTLGALVADIGIALKASRESGLAFASINAEVRRFVDIFDEISGSTVELAAGSAEIMKAMTELLSQTGTIRTGSAEIEAETRAIEGSLKSIKEASERSRDDLGEIDSMTKLVNVGIREVSSLALSSSAGLESLSQEIGVFKTA